MIGAGIGGPVGSLTVGVFGGMTGAAIGGAVAGPPGAAVGAVTGGLAGSAAGGAAGVVAGAYMGELAGGAVAIVGPEVLDKLGDAVETVPHFSPARAAFEARHFRAGDVVAAPGMHVAGKMRGAGDAYEQQAQSEAGRNRS
jgi:hypothetical protein